MPVIKQKNGTLLGSNVLMKRGDEISLKVEQVDKQIKLSFTSSAPAILEIAQAEYDSRNKSWNLKITAKNFGAAVLKTQATVPPGMRFAVPPPVQIRVQPEAIKFADIWKNFPSGHPYLDKDGKTPVGYDDQCTIKLSIA